MKCPEPTQDTDLNIANQKKAMDKVGYGPENPSGEDDKFWESKADEWNLSIDEAKSRRCGNCAVFNQSSDMMGCITKGMGDSVTKSVENKEIGYCESLNFICSSKRTCDAWAPRKKEEKVTMLDAYFQKVDAFLAVIEAKDATAVGTYEIDVETKVRKVKDSAYWGRPVGTPITPGMKPEGPKSPLGRARAAAGGGGTSGGAKPKKRIRPAGKKPSKPAGGERSDVAGADKPEIAGSDKPDAPAGAKPKPKKRIKPKPKQKKPEGRVTPEMEDRFKKMRKRVAQISDDLDVSLMDEEFENLRNAKNREDAEWAVGNMADILEDAGDATQRRNYDALMRMVGEAWGDKKPKGGRSSDPGPRGMTDDEREEFDDLDQFGKDRYTGARNHGYDHDTAMEYAEGMGGSQVELDADNDPDSDFARAVMDGKLREWTDKQKERGLDGDEVIGPNTKVVDAKDFSVGKAAKELKKIKKDGRKDGTGSETDPIDVGDDIELAHKLLSEGKHIRMKDERAVSTLLDKLHETVKDAKAKGDKAPEYDLCKVSVPKTNLFCVESKGIPRTKMPQFKGTPVDGSFAATKTNDKGEGDVEPEFRDLLRELGINTEMSTVKASELRASQDNLDGPKVVGMAQAMREGKIPDAPIFVTRDGYILDGHHRWAAKVAIDLDDGVSGDIEMPVEIIDAEIGYLIDLANGFTEIAGIKPKGLGAAAEGVKRMVINPDGTLCIPCMAK